MSKSLGNGVAPDDLVAREGADAGRIYEMFIGPPDEDAEWTDEAVAGPVRFLQRVWRLVLDPDTVPAANAGPTAADLRRRVHQTVRRVTDEYEHFRFNTAVAALMELGNVMQDYLAGGGARGAGWDEAVSVLVRLLNPMAPHVAEELWERIGAGGLCADAPWPVSDAAAAAEAEVTLVVQVDGRVRDRLRVPAGLDEASATERALASETALRALGGDGRRPRRVVYVPDKLINLVP